MRTTLTSKFINDILKNNFKPPDYLITEKAEELQQKNDNKP